MQENYRNFIQQKLEVYWKKYPPCGHLSATTTPEQRNTQSNILIFLRKLREGLMASKRIDDFSLEVYETSLYLSVLFRTPAQTTSIISQLLPQGAGESVFYSAHSSMVNDGLSSRVGERSGMSRRSKREPARSTQSQHGLPWNKLEKRLAPGTGSSRLQGPHPHPFDRPNTILPPTYLSTWLLSLLHTLLRSYPSRSIYYSQLRQFQHYPNTENMTGWLKSVLAALESRNYVRFEKLTRSAEVEAAFRSLFSAGTKRLDMADTKIGYFALTCLVSDLRASVRESAWTVLGTAYRELDVTQSADWLLRVLMINLDTGAVNIPGGAVPAAHDWLATRPASEVRKKEGAGLEGRWILCNRK